MRTESVPETLNDFHALDPAIYMPERILIEPMAWLKYVTLFVLSTFLIRAGVSKAVIIWKLTYEGRTRPKTRGNDKDVCVVTLLPANFNCLGKGDCSVGVFLLPRINMALKLPAGHAMPYNRPWRTARRMLKLKLYKVHCFRQQSKVTSKKGLLCRHRTSNGSRWFCVAYCCQWRHSVLGISSEGTGHSLFWYVGTFPTSLYNVMYSVCTKLYISIVIFIYIYTQNTYIRNIYIYIDR